jgi:murein DD-endopeptidase MepM/ murein hydrolase activator NlpD
VTKIGWAILAVIVLVALAFGAMLSFGPGVPAPAARVTAVPEPTKAGSAALMMPVVGVQPSQLVDTWGQTRGEGARAHQAIDIMAAAGTPVIAAAPGTIEKLFQSAAGGITLYVRSPDRGWSYYYAHLAGYAPGVREGKSVRIGETLGFVGDTGNAGAGNTHLHFAITRMPAEARWHAGEPVNPYPLLASGRLPR